MGPTWVLSAPGGSHVNPMKFACRDNLKRQEYVDPTLSPCQCGDDDDGNGYGDDDDEEEEEEGKEEEEPGYT